MSDGPLRDVTDTFGALVYCGSYIPIWIGWNFVGKHLVRAFQDVRERSDVTALDEVIEMGASLETLRNMIANAYYHRVLLAEKERLCARFA